MLSPVGGGVKSSPNLSSSAGWTPWSFVAQWVYLIILRNSSAPETMSSEAILAWSSQGSGAAQPSFWGASTKEALCLWFFTSQLLWAGDFCPFSPIAHSKLCLLEENWFIFQCFWVCVSQEPHHCSSTVWAESQNKRHFSIDIWWCTKREISRSWEWPEQLKYISEAKQHVCVT